MANKHQISDELLAAYLEGNANKNEVAEVLNALGTDAELRETLDIALQLDDEDLPMMQMAAEGNRNLCDVQCEAYVLKRSGIDCNVDDLLEVAKENHWIRRAGTPLNCIGNLIEHMGKSVLRKYDATIEDIKDALNKGRGVIVAVDSDKLYPERPDEEDATNHAVVVTGINTKTELITIYDPENINEVDINISLFTSAWQESNCYMVKIK